MGKLNPIQSKAFQCMVGSDYDSGRFSRRRECDKNIWKRRGNYVQDDPHSIRKVLRDGTIEEFRQINVVRLSEARRNYKV